MKDMKKILLFTALLSTLLFPQLKELEVKPTENRGGIPIFRDHPDKAGIIFYTQFDNLKFYSSYGIVDVKGDPAGGKYVVIIEPVRQTIEVRAPGFKTEMIRLETLQPRDVLYYEVLPKKEEGVQGVTEVGITVQVTPSDADITLDGVAVKNDMITPFKIGKHTLSVLKAGYRPYTSEIEISPTNTLFKVSLEKVNLAQVFISSTPQGAELKINGEVKGTTDKGLFLFPGDYELGLTLDQFLPVTETIRVSGNEQKDKFNYKLTKKRGFLELTIQPDDALVKLNGQSTPYNSRYELPPGTYTLEVDKELYLPFQETIQIVLGETVKKSVSLTQNFGTIKVTTTPSDAVLKLNGSVKPSTGNYDLIPGRYIIEISADKYLPKTDTINLRSGETVIRNFNLTRNRGTLQLSVSPADALVKLNGERLTQTGNIELAPGSYNLEVTASRHLPYTEKLEIGIGTQLKRDVKLEKNTGKILLTLSPTDATVLLNREPQSNRNEIEVTPGLYEVTVSKETYRSQTFTVEVKKGDAIRKTVTLAEITGSLQFSVAPLEAEVSLTRNGAEISKWKGMKIIENLRIGEYEITLKLKGYKTIRKKAVIEENKSTAVDFQMVQGSDSPEGMVWVEGGTFTMGCTSEQSNCDSDEKPTHTVTLNGFFIGKTEVTQELWESVMGNNPSSFKGVRRPVEQVSWYEAVEFCNKLSEKEGLQKAYRGSGSSITCDFNANGYRLPTEAEWEYAARGGAPSTNTEYSGSNNIEDVAWYGSNSGSTTHDAGTKSPNQLGICDMSGNVWEWCWDWKGEYTTSSQTNPTGPNSGSYRVLRGGGWSGNAVSCRVAYRSGFSPDFRINYFGFRLARTR